MADVTGPISSLPGSFHTPSKRTVCDKHPQRKAVVRVQGETDSFGSEMHDLCAECLVEHNKPRPPMEGRCNWCKNMYVGLKPRRDYEEGMAGPVYYVCQPCITKDNARAAEEYEADRSYYDEDYDD